MVSALRDFEALRVVLAGDAIDKSMLCRDTPRPPTGPIALERLWLARPLERRSQTLIDQLGQPRRDLGVMLLEMEKLVPSSSVEQQPHNVAGSTSIPAPALSRAMAASSARALAGLARR